LASKIAECLSNDKLRPHIAAVGETGLDYSEGEKRRGAKQVAGRFVLVR
jgi:Tat protein secretion system quality control protein TatD with DNase activity